MSFRETGDQRTGGAAPRCMRAARTAGQALVALLVLSVSGLALAQSSILTLASNIDETSVSANSRLGLAGYDNAQAFLTGAYPRGYTLTSVDIKLAVGSGTPTAAISIYTVSNSNPGTKLADLTAPASLATGTNTFTHSGLHLEPDTYYFIVAHHSAGSAVAIDNTLSDSESGESGWVIDHGRRWRTQGTTSWSSHTSVWNIRIKGSVNIHLPEADLFFTGLSIDGIWGNDETIWIMNRLKNELSAFSRETGYREISKNIPTGLSCSSGVWGDGTTIWVGQSGATCGAHRLVAFNIATKTHDAAKDILLTGISHARGVWGNDTTIWVADIVQNIVYAYNRATKARDTAKDVSLVAANDYPWSLWSDGTTLWVGDWQDHKIYAYTLATKARDAAKDINLPPKGPDQGGRLNERGKVLGMWSDGYTLWATWSEYAESGRQVAAAYDLLTSNAPPVTVGAIPRQILAPDAPLSSIDLTRYFYDQDDTILTYTLTSAGNSAVVSAALDSNATALQLTPAANALDANTVIVSTEITVTATDSDDQAATQSVMVYVTRNQAPTAQGRIPAQTVDEVSALISISLTDYFSDPEGDVLTYTVRESPALSALDTSIRDDTVTYAARGGGGKTVTVIVTATDQLGRSAEQSFTVRIEEPPSMRARITPVASSVVEGEEAQFRLTIYNWERRALAVKVGISEDETSGSDFVAAADEGQRTISVPADSPVARTYIPGIGSQITTTVTFSVPTVDDNEYEEDGTLKVVVYRSRDYVSERPATVSVKNNDRAPRNDGPRRVSVRSERSSVSEGTAAKFRVWVSPNAPAGGLTVTLTVNEAPGSDFVAAGDEGTKTLSVAGGVASQIYSVPTIDDATDESDGWVRVTLTAPAGADYLLGSFPSAVVNVRDNDETVGITTGGGGGGGGGGGSRGGGSRGGGSRGGGSRGGGGEEASAQPVFFFEIPKPDSSQSGMGVISGWVCEAETVEVELGSSVFKAAYGTERADTAGRCGDIDNGFGLLFNWNLLGDGTHSVRLRIDGTIVATRFVSVTTLGPDYPAFVEEVQGETVLPDFPQAGAAVRLVWQQGRQHFALAPPTPAAQGSSVVDVDPTWAVLENPAPGSYQSGIGVISGWVCEAETVAVEIDRTHRFEAAYGTERADTAGRCGDIDNGFGLLFNWNLLGDGTHSVRLLVDEEEWATATFTVTTLGVEVVEGVTYRGRVADFPQPGTTVVVEWQEAQQNFVIVGVE